MVFVTRRAMLPRCGGSARRSFEAEALVRFCAGGAEQSVSLPRQPNIFDFELSLHAWFYKKALHRAFAGFIRPETPAQRDRMDTWRQTGCGKLWPAHPWRRWCPKKSLTSAAAFHYLVAGCPDYRGRSDPGGEFVNWIASRAERASFTQSLRRYPAHAS
jgi:hypothetical protein